jgi:Bacterial SH3 domain
MKQLLIALCMIGGTWFLVSTYLKTNENDNRPLVTEKVSAPTLVEQNKPDPDQLQAINPAAGQSRHAIVPDRPPALVARSESPSQPEKNSPPEIGPTPGDHLQVKSEASVRSGPSDSAQVIGTAHPGAKLQVHSRDAEWVQFVDPATKYTGWLSLAVLDPADDGVEVPVTVPKTLKKPSRPAKPAKTRNAQQKSQKAQHKRIRPPSGYAELPRDQEFGPPRRRERFGFVLRRRFSGDEPSPYPFW